MIKLTKYERRAQNMAKIGSLKCVIEIVIFILHKKTRYSFQDFLHHVGHICNIYMLFHIPYFSYKSIFLHKNNMIFLSRFLHHVEKIQYNMFFHILYSSYQSHITYLHKKKSLYISVHSIHSEIKTFIQRCQKMSTKVHE